MNVSLYHATIYYIVVTAGEMNVRNYLHKFNLHAMNLFSSKTIT